ncbi:uncharacterized protein LOC144053957 [Vanacampus margaritifer]
MHEAAVMRRSVVHIPGDPPPRRSATASRKHTRWWTRTQPGEEEIQTRRLGPGGQSSRVLVTHNTPRLGVTSSFSLREMYRHPPYSQRSFQDGLRVKGDSKKKTKKRNTSLSFSPTSRVKYIM